MDRILQKKHDLRAALRTLKLFYAAVKQHPLHQEILSSEKDQAVQAALEFLQDVVTDEN